MLKCTSVCGKLFILFIFAVVSFYIPTDKADARLVSYSKKVSVWDVKASGLNIRSGPGSVYPVIAQVSKGADLVDYCPSADCGLTTGGDFEWSRVYYQNASIGYYANAASGWAAMYNTVGNTVFNFHYTHVAKTSRATSMYTSDCSNLSGMIRHFPEQNYYLQSFDSELMASPCNPNAWRLQDPQGDSDAQGYFYSGFVNGWNLKAE
nr:SH3 domain-containing protein [Paenibacillus xylanexedens]